jgi:hypothetical protein
LSGVSSVDRHLLFYSPCIDAQVHLDSTLPDGTAEVRCS